MRRSFANLLAWFVLVGAFFGGQRSLAQSGAEPRSPWKAGVATTVITPTQPMWMAGYAARDKPSQGKVHDLKAKALALEDAEGTRWVIVTLDLLGISRSMRDGVVAEAAQRYELPPESLLLSASHTHCGPAVSQTKWSIYGDRLYGLSEREIQESRRYAERLQEKLAGLIGRALDDLAPARLSYSHARAGFAMNRRLKTERGYGIAPNPDGPVDHDVPVLCVESSEAKLRAILFGYACHCTTLSFYQFCGDYAGFAQQYIEQRHPGTTAMFVAGCGGDQNPYPRRGPDTLQYCAEHGRALANGVEAALASRARPVLGPLTAAVEEVTLDFAEPPSRGQLTEQAESSNPFAKRHAGALLEELDRNGRIRTTYPYLVQVVSFGQDLTMIAMAGEVVVDYSLRFKAELTDRPLWVAAYCNDVFGYVPSRRVLEEGGYEGGGAMLYTPLPGPFAPSVEERIVRKVHELVGRLRMAAGK